MVWSEWSTKGHCLWHRALVAAPQWDGTLGYGASDVSVTLEVSPCTGDGDSRLTKFLASLFIPQPCLVPVSSLVDALTLCPFMILLLWNPGT